MRRRRQRALWPRNRHTDDAATSSGRVSAAGWVLLGLVLGLAAGLWYAWMVEPVVFVEVSPARFNERYQAEYIFLVSQSYAANGNWPQTEQRLAALDDSAIGQTVANLLERYVREQEPAAVIRNLAMVARQLGVETQAVALFAPTPLHGNTATPTAILTVLPTPTPMPSASPTLTAIATVSPTPTPLPTSIPTAVVSPTAQPNYRLLSQERLCLTDAPAPRIEIVTQDALLNPLPGVEVLVSWNGGADRFFTGFKPAEGPSYGDFTMSQDVSYTVALAEGSEAVSGLRIEPCDNGLDGGWRLTFQNLRLRITATPEGEE